MKRHSALGVPMLAPLPRRRALAWGLAAGTALWLADTRPAAAQSPNSAAGLRSDASSSAPTAPALPGLQGMRWAGSGLLRVWGFEVYRARLWVGPRFTPANHASDTLALELEYLRAFTAASIASRSIDEMRRQQDFSPEQAQCWQRDLQGVLPDVRAGDRLLGVYRPATAAQFWQNQRLLGELPDALFARLFFGIWLAPTTSEPALRSALLSALPAA